MRKKSLFTYKKQKVQHPRTGIAPFLFIQKFLLLQYHFAGLLATISHGLYDDVDATLQLAYLNTIGRVDLGAQNIGKVAMFSMPVLVLATVASPRPPISLAARTLHVAEASSTL